MCWHSARTSIWWPAVEFCWEDEIFQPTSLHYVICFLGKDISSNEFITSLLIEILGDCGLSLDQAIELEISSYVLSSSSSFVSMGWFIKLSREDKLFMCWGIFLDVGIYWPISIRLSVTITFSSFSLAAQDNISNITFSFFLLVNMKEIDPKSRLSTLNLNAIIHSPS